MPLCLYMFFTLNLRVCWTRLNSPAALETVFGAPLAPLAPLADPPPPNVHQEPWQQHAGLSASGCTQPPSCCMTMVRDLFQAYILAGKF